MRLILTALIIREATGKRIGYVILATTNFCQSFKKPNSRNAILRRPPVIISLQVDIYVLGYMPSADTKQHGGDVVNRIHHVVHFLQRNGLSVSDTSSEVQHHNLDQSRVLGVWNRSIAQLRFLSGGIVMGRFDTPATCPAIAFDDDWTGDDSLTWDLLDLEYIDRFDATAHVRSADHHEPLLIDGQHAMKES